MAPSIVPMLLVCMRYRVSSHPGLITRSEAAGIQHACANGISNTAALPSNAVRVMPNRNQRCFGDSNGHRGVRAGERDFLGIKSRMKGIAHRQPRPKEKMYWLNFSEDDCPCARKKQGLPVRPAAVDSRHEVQPCLARGQPGW